MEEQKTTQTQNTEQKAPETKPETKAPETKPETKAPETKPETPKSPEAPKPESKKPVDPQKYERYVNLKFIKLEGGQLREDYEKELDVLEKELKSCSGKKAAKTRTASIGMGVLRFVEGIPVPKELENQIPEKDRNFYLVK